VDEGGFERACHSFAECGSLTEEEQHKVADAIVEHLESTNWKIEHGPPAEGHGQRLMPK
jgi:hypothetical protein